MSNERLGEPSDAVRERVEHGRSLSRQKLADGFLAHRHIHAQVARHQELSGMRINWLGTYEHAAKRWLSHLEQIK
ncbi:MAG: hypothetical protein KKC71_05960 [Chloroflexi bacterium]|nr:hypothetical protein [Chloroflexota bacterium]